MFRLSHLISEEDKDDIPSKIQIDMENFISHIIGDDIVLKDISVFGTKAKILGLLEKVYSSSYKNLIVK